ncbi:helix-turn-helix domain-containing protein [uncultured Phascolarctobacterium sp.]|uniref:helix-turn-helix domain-containing protein n=1 Tax=uncultured Phascolarctobacterium sp. TaxID=512296 RepID=UPI0027D9C9F2|nr:helix-turn-helix domain-containing protein [uncultured Phascolarctobacterium sp.]
MAKRKPKFLTINQLLEFLGPNTINRMTIYKQIWGGNIPAKKIGRKFLIPMKWIEKEFGEYNEQ